MANPSGSDLKLSSLLNLDGLESVLSSVTSDLTSLRQSVAQLEQRLNDAVPSPEFVDFSTRAATVLDEVKRKISRIEHSITIPSTNDQTTVGSVVSAQQERVDELTATVTKKASIEDVNGACEAIMAELSAFQSKVSVESATTLDITNITKVQENQAQHVAALEGLLNAKMDKMEAAQTQAAAEKIADFASTYAAMKYEIRDLHERLAKVVTQQQETDQSLSSLRVENEKLRVLLQSAAGMEELETVSASLAKAEKALALTSTKGDMQKLEKTQDIISSTLGELSRSLADAKKGEQACA